MNFSDKKFSYTELRKSLDYDQIFTLRNHVKEFPYEILIITEWDKYNEIMIKINEIDSRDYSFQPLYDNTNRNKIMLSVRFKDKNKMLKFKLKSAII